MSEKPESDEFEEEDAEDAAPGGDEVDVDHIMRDVESQRRRAPKGAEPAWRRLERVMEERRTQELLSDFADYKIGGADERGARKQNRKRKRIPNRNRTTRRSPLQRRKRGAKVRPAPI